MSRIGTKEARRRLREHEDQWRARRFAQKDVATARYYKTYCGPTARNPFLDSDLGHAARRDLALISSDMGYGGWWWGSERFLGSLAKKSRTAARESLNVLLHYRYLVRRKTAGNRFVYIVDPRAMYKGSEASRVAAINRFNALVEIDMAAEGKLLVDELRPSLFDDALPPEEVEEDDGEGQEDEELDRPA